MRERVSAGGRHERLQRLRATCPGMRIRAWPEVRAGLDAFGVAGFRGQFPRKPD